MTIYHFVKTLLLNLKYIILIPLFSGLLIYLLTINQPRKYSTHTNIFTGITSNSSIDDMNNNRVDFFAIQNDFNNMISIILSQSVLEETSLRLFTSHLMIDEPTPEIISNESFQDLKEIVPDEIKKLIVANDFEQSYQNIQNSMEQDRNNFIYGLINFVHPHYSIEALSEIKVERQSTSDIIQISYESDDPGICYNTIKTITKVFFKKHYALQQNQTFAAVDYFEKQLENATNKLNETEERLLKFNSKNNIINYYEQTKHISLQQEIIDVKLQDIRLEYEASKAVLAKLETEIEISFNINLSNKEILSIREKLIKVNQELTLSEFKGGRGKEYKALLSEMNKLELQLENRIDSVYIYDNNSQGIDIKYLLNNWLRTIKEYESSNARLISMNQKRNEFQQVFSKYAPLGAKLKRIEREIRVKEEAYLEILHDLGLAQLRQQNADIKANMKVLDNPSLPINPMPTKRRIIVMVVSLFSLIFYVLALFIFELFDKRVKNISKLREYTNLEVPGAFCIKNYKDGYNTEELLKRSVNNVMESILFQRPITQNKKPLIIQFLSHWNSEGKSYILDKVLTGFELSGYKCFKINFESIDKNLKEKNILNYSDYPEYLSEDYGNNYNTADYVFVEVPALSANIYNPTIMQSADINFLIVDASRTWSAADDFRLGKLKDILGDNLQTLLNKTLPDNMEDMIGEIPKKRTWLRAIVKNKLLNRFL
jgi:polysaccharide biosynthesis transport protein